MQETGQFRYAPLRVTVVIGRSLLVCAAAVNLVSMPASALGAPLSSPPSNQTAKQDGWLTGGELKRQLTQPISMSWTDTPFRRAVQDLATSQRVAILLDRRIDPDQKITLSLSSAPLEEVLARVADNRRAELVQMGPVAYIGPANAARRLRTLAALRAEDAQRLSAERRKPILSARPWAWDDLATPRELISGLAQEAGIEVEGQVQVPHDLWAAQSLPPLSWIDRLTLVAAQFDLTFQFDSGGRIVRLVAIPQHVALRRSYPGGTGVTEKARQWRELAPEATIEVASGRIVVSGRLEDHERLNGSAKPAATKTPATARRPGTEVHTLTVRQVPLDKLLAEFEKKLNLRFEWDQDALAKAGISTTANVSVEVKNATLDELLTATFEPLGLSFRRQGQVVKIGPKS